MDWIAQHIPSGRAVMGYAAARIPADASPDLVIAVANRAADTANQHPGAEVLRAHQVATIFVTVPLHEVPTDVFDDGHDRAVDLAVVAILHMPEGAGTAVGTSGRYEVTFPPVGWEDRSE